MRPFRFGAQHTSGAGAEDWAARARRVEQDGYSTLSMPDHLDDQLAPLTALGAAAAATSGLRIGTLVLGNDYRHPVVVAKDLATLDVLSGGRVEAGLGAGWSREDYRWSGIAYDDPATRVARLAEAIDVVQGCWTGKPFDHDGEHYQVRAYRGAPEPCQRPHPPLLVGGGSRRVLELAARRAEIVGLNFDMRGGAIGPGIGASGTVGASERKLAWVRGAAGDRFDDLELQVTVFMAAVTSDRDSFAQLAGGVLGLPVDEVLDCPHVLAGTVDEIVDTLRERRDRYGLSYVTISAAYLPTAVDDLAPVVSRLTGC
jgi:probable F420-dependent oxidoreductase